VSESPNYNTIKPATAGGRSVTTRGSGIAGAGARSAGTRHTAVKVIAVVFVDVRWVAVEFIVHLALPESRRLGEAATTFRITPSAAIKPCQQAMLLLLATTIGHPDRTGPTTLGRS
jgi:hypothetical protein